MSLSPEEREAIRRSRLEGRKAKHTKSKTTDEDRALPGRKRRLYNLVDLLSLVAEGGPVTTEDLWTRVLGREGYVTSRSSDARQAERHFRALVDLVRELGFKLYRREQEGDEAGNQAKWQIVFDQPVETWDAVNDALEQISDVIETPRQAGKRKSERTLTMAQVADEIGVSRTAVLHWLKLRVPHTLAMEPRRHYLFDLKEVEEWLLRRRADSWVWRSHGLERMPVDEARPVLLDVKNKLNLGVEEFAELLDVPKSTLDLWLWRSDAPPIPKEKVEAAKVLLELEEPRLSIGRKVTKKDVEQAIRDAKGVKTKAARQLGVDRSTLDDWIKRYGIEAPDRGPLVARFYPDQIRAAMRKVDNVVYKAAGILGISNIGLAKMIREYRHGG